MKHFWCFWLSPPPNPSCKRISLRNKEKHFQTNEHFHDQPTKIAAALFFLGISQTWEEPETNQQVIFLQQAMVCFKLVFLQGYEKLLRVDCSLDLCYFKNHPFFKFPARELHCHHLVDVLRFKNCNSTGCGRWNGARLESWTGNWAILYFDHFWKPEGQIKIH